MKFLNVQQYMELVGIDDYRPRMLEQVVKAHKIQTHTLYGSPDKFEEEIKQYLQEQMSINTEADNIVGIRYSRTPVMDVCVILMGVTPEDLGNLIRKTIRMRAFL